SCSDLQRYSCPEGAGPRQSRSRRQILRGFEPARDRDQACEVTPGGAASVGRRRAVGERRLSLRNWLWPRIWQAAILSAARRARESKGGVRGCVLSRR